MPMGDAGATRHPQSAATQDWEMSPVRAWAPTSRDGCNSLTHLIIRRSKVRVLPGPSPRRGGYEVFGEVAETERRAGVADRAGDHRRDAFVTE